MRRPSRSSAFRRRGFLLRQPHRCEIDRVDRDELVVATQRGTGDAGRILERRCRFLVLSPFDQDVREAIQRRGDDWMSVAQSPSLVSQYLTKDRFCRSIVATGGRNQREVMQGRIGVRVILAAGLTIRFKTEVEQ